MRRIFVIAFICLAASSSAIGQMKNKPEGRNANVEQELIRIENKLTAAILKRDVAVFEDALAEDYIFTDSGSDVHYKADVLGYLKSGGLINETYELSDLRVRVYGASGVVTGRLRTRWRAGGDGAVDQDRFMDVFVKQKQGWKLAASQTTRISREPLPAKE